LDDDHLADGTLEQRPLNSGHAVFAVAGHKAGSPDFELRLPSAEFQPFVTIICPMPDCFYAWVLFAARKS
jgi:hypothetical protein